MVYAPQRRHAVASLAMTTQAIGLMQHLYTPNTLILFARVLAQIQITGAAYIHPHRSLFTLFFMLTLMNMAAVMLDLLDFVGGMNGGKGLMLDFVGQADPASLTRVIVLDLLLYIMQLTSLIVSYINNHAKDLPSSSVFLYEDLLLPPRDLSSASSTALDEDDLDLEGGEGKQRRRKGKGTAYEPLEGDANKLWLNDDDDEPDSSATRICKPGTSVPIDAAHGPLLASSRRPLLSPSVRSYRRHHEPPLIFSLPLSHIIQLIFQLPSPTPPPPVLAGGTPVPVATPVTEEPPPLSSIQEGDEEAESSEEEEEEVVDGVGGGSPSSRRRGRMRGAAGIMPDVGRIPGEYRTGSGRGNGG